MKAIVSISVLVVLLAIGWWIASQNLIENGEIVGSGNININADTPLDIIAFHEDDVVVDTGNVSIDGNTWYPITLSDGSCTVWTVETPYGISTYSQTNASASYAVTVQFTSSGIISPYTSYIAIFNSSFSDFEGLKDKNGSNCGADVEPYLMTTGNFTGPSASTGIYFSIRQTYIIIFSGPAINATSFSYILSVNLT